MKLLFHTRWSNIYNQLNLKAGIIILLSSIMALIYYPFKVGLSIFIGGLIAMANFRGMNRGLKGLNEGQTLKIRLIILNIIRLFLVFIILFILIYSHLVNGLGLLLGLTISFIIIIKEGLLCSV